MRFFTSSGHTSIMDSHSSPNGDTAAFLSKQKVMWKGFINMQSIAKFVTKAYLVSGSCELLEEDLPDTVQIGGRISPDIVWDYVMKVKTSVTKELCLMRFHPASEEEEVAYISLFSYFNSRGRFGVVANNSHRVKDLYLIPLSAKAPIPSKLGPVEGPGLEANHPNLLLGLAICQKPKCPGAVQSERAEEKRSRVAPGPPDDPALPELPVPPSAAIKEEKDTAPNQNAVISTSPPGSPSSVSSSDSSSSFFSTSLLLQRLKPLAAPAPVTSISSKETSSSTAPAITPLQTILKTLFGKNKPESQGSQSPSEQNVVKKEVSPVPILDPVLQQFCRVPNEKVEGDEYRKINHPKVELNSKTGGGIPEKEFKVEADEDDRPYDPEEEYYPGMGGEVDGKEKPFDMEMERNVPMSNRVKKEYDRPYDPEEEYNPEICYWTEEDDDGDDRPYDLEAEYNSKIGPGEAEDDDDRPYDPEEEYNLGMGCGMEAAQKNQTSKLSEAFSDDEVAYDPEDDTIFEEVKGHFADSPHRVKGQLPPKTDGVSGSESLTLTEQRKMLEELNKQIEEQERQLAEQEEALRQQRAAVGESKSSPKRESPPLQGERDPPQLRCSSKFEATDARPSYRHRRGQDGKSLERPVRRALLPTPADGPIFLPRLLGNGPDHHRKDWRHSPDMRSGVTELDSCESRDNMFGGYRHDDEEAQFPSRLQAERQQELPGDRRREWNDSPIRDWERNWSREQERGCDRGIDEEKHWGEDDGHEPVRDRELPELGRRRHKVWNRRDRERSRIRDRIKDQKYDRHHPEEGCGHPLSREHGRHRGRDRGRVRSRNIQEGCNLRDRCRREEET
ncbi:hypothetical protein GJAV_G00182870 [Gymnothorax javanicus]|nr:hypothetical protein GJAV_G00182870 [Gymnothorax javanicus]